jgi:predicted GH43/DUF377 family glycosyl hydrolase
MKTKIVILFVAFLIKIPSFGSDFIKQIHQINIPGAPGAYNASLIEHENGFIMAFRYDRYLIPIERYPHEYYQHICLVKLDEEFNSIGEYSFCRELGERAYDPRLVRVGSNIYLIYTSHRPEHSNSLMSSMLCLSRIQPKSDGFKIQPPTPLYVSFQQRWEKNWVPFDYKGTFLMGYTINPHVIISPSHNGSSAHLFTSSPQISWNFGIIRGGTPAVLVDDEYLAFFHSSVFNPLTGWYTYYMGAYTFKSKPPFTLTRISIEPFYHPDFYSIPHTPLSSSLVIFPAGLVVKNNRIFISYGENDAGIKVMEIDKELLYKSLRPVSP